MHGEVISSGVVGLTLIRGLGRDFVWRSDKRVRRRVLVGNTKTEAEIFHVRSLFFLSPVKT